MAKRPPRPINVYNQHLNGVYGVFGSGTSLQAFYLQSAITPSDLDRISLISDIRGSEQWPVRDLFQRDVDNKRIENSLLPYLETMEKIKFFNPLTLTVLPMADDGHTVLKVMPKTIERALEEDGEQWQALEREDFYRIQWIGDSYEYARLKWNDKRSKLVAIDGQHRLSALKRFLVHHNAGAAHDAFMSWRIPVIVVSFRAIGEQEPPSVLEVVRSIFIYINTQAHEVNKARAILLSDESINSVCAQELIQYSHANDVKAAEERDPKVLPLLFYDWRGEESEQSRVAASAAVKTVEEVQDWLELYILGEDFGDEQKAALGVVPTHRLHGAFAQQRLYYQDSDHMRAYFKAELLPALAHLLENFMPLRNYVEGLRKLEKIYLEGKSNELASHAFTKLRFGSSHAPVSIENDVEGVLVEIEDDVRKLKSDIFGALMAREIGMRGVVFAFGSLAKAFSYPDWREYSEWFTDSLNCVYEAGLLETRDRTARGHLRHVAIDHNDQVVNYRLDDAAKALGAYVEVLVGTYGQPMPKAWKDWESIKELRLDTLRDTVIRGYKKEVRPLLREEHPDGGKKLTEAVKKEAEKRAGRQMRRFEKMLKGVEEE